MTPASTTAIINDAIVDYAVALITIIFAIVNLGVAYLLFRFGWRALKNESGISGDFEYQQHVEASRQLGRKPLSYADYYKK